MEALSIVRTILTKKLISSVDNPRKGPPGHGLLAILRLLLYAMFKELFSTRHLVRHLTKYPDVWKSFGLKRKPDRRTIDRWKRDLLKLSEKIIACR